MCCGVQKHFLGVRECFWIDLGPSEGTRMNFKKIEKIQFSRTFHALFAYKSKQFCEKMAILAREKYSKSIFSKSKPLIKNQLDRSFYYQPVFPALKGEALTTRR